jgi:single-stranded-DNA-specific exonuclease
LKFSSRDTIPPMQPTLPTPDELESMLAERLGLTAETKQDFLYPKYELGNPFLFSDMDRAVTRIKQAIAGGEQIGIYADYDCDGIPAAIILLDLFKALKIADRVHIYIPDRHDEGYGVSTQGIDVLQEKGVTLIVTVDMGITALAEVADAQSRGIDMIVTDHHHMLLELPAAYAVIHPDRGTYPEKCLCGAGVAFTLVRGFLQNHGAEYGIKEGWEKWLLDLVGFATLSDMVSLGGKNGGENRVLAAYGLTVMRKTRRVGIRTLLAVNNISLDRLTEQDLTFTIAPRLNAASRMDTPMLAFSLLATDDPRAAHAIVQKLEAINGDRKLLVARIVKEAHASLDRRELFPIVVIGNPEWRPAVLGLVANKLQETYGRSFFVWGGNGSDVLKGSCRMVSEHHAARIFQSLPEGIVVDAGGHQAAGGFSITKEKVHFLEQALNDALTQMDAAEEVTENTDAPLSLLLASATARHYEVIRRFAPFGVGNPEPKFLFENVEVVSVKKFGKAKEHLECVVRDMTGEMTAFTFFVSPSFVSKVLPGSIISFSAAIEPGWKSGMRLRIKEVL